MRRFLTAAKYATYLKASQSERGSRARQDIKEKAIAVARTHNNVLNLPGQIANRSISAARGATSSLIRSVRSLKQHSRLMAYYLAFSLLESAVEMTSAMREIIE